MTILDVQSFANFDAAAREVLAFLRQRLGFDLWMVTRVEGEDWIVLQSDDHGYGIKDGTVLRWSDSFCAQMVCGKGPRVAPNSQVIPAYKNAPIGQQISIGAYVGVPLVLEGGTLFGTLCAVHPNPQSDAICAELPMIELLSRLLSRLLESDLKATEQIRRTEQAQAEAWSDSLTGLYNRRGWDQLMACEETRCQQYGHPACVVAIDLDGLKQVNDTQGHKQGDELIRQAGNAIQQAIRKQDVAARVGGDEFAVLCVDCNDESGERVMDRLQDVFDSFCVSASLGFAVRNPSQGLNQAWQEADQAMYVAKNGRKIAQPCSHVA